MALANVSLSDTFYNWLTRTNQLIYGFNLSTEGQSNSTGTLTLTNPSYLNGNVTINIANGVMKIKGNTFDANATVFTSNTTSLKFSGSGNLGTVVYLDINSLSTSVFDTSKSNIASANSVFTSYKQATSAFDQANTAYNQATLAFNQANTSLPNTSGATFAGDLKITGILDLL